jgi:translation initiation factor IF-3
MEILGKIKLITETKKVGNNDFKKREVVITTQEQYPQNILVEFVQDKCDLLKMFSIGQEVKVSINLKGREWLNNDGVSKYFNVIQGWKIIDLNSNESNNRKPPEFIL